MRLNYLFTAAVLLCTQAQGQSTEGITHVPDISYTITSAYNSTKKKYPEIQIAAETHYEFVKEKKDIPYCKAGDRKLLLDAFYQKSKTPQPAIIIIFGGGWRSGNRTLHYPLAEKLASLGYACFTPDYRLSTEALYPAAVHDVKAAIRWVRANAKKYHVNPDKITVLGFSAGGELASFAGATNKNPAFEGEQCSLKYSSEVQAVIDIDGTLSFVHPESGEGDDTKKKSASTLWFGYSRAENFELLKQASPLTWVGKTTPPFLFINSSVERMHAGRNDFIKVMDANKIYSEVHSFENSPHGFCLFDPWFQPTVKYIDDFMKKIFPVK